MKYRMVKVFAYSQHRIFLISVSHKTTCINAGYQSAAFASHL
jgi:hypothetical protein